MIVQDSKWDDCSRSETLLFGWLHTVATAETDSQQRMGGVGCDACSIDTEYVRCTYVVVSGDICGTGLCLERFPGFRRAVTRLKPRIVEPNMTGRASKRVTTVTESGERS
jgi:hypothetical protein